MEEVRELPGDVVFPPEEFAADYASKVGWGRMHAGKVPVAFVGLARNCRERMLQNLAIIERLRCEFASLTVHVVENDSTDGTGDALLAWCDSREWATCDTQTLNRKHRPAEFEGPRTRDLAEYRTMCQDAVRRGPVPRFVVVLDFDCPLWSEDGLFHGIATLASDGGAYASASVSMAEHNVVSIHEGQPVNRVALIHYDAWALRLNSFWDDYQTGFGGWKHHWLPAVGSPPVPVCSAFGGLCIYNASAYLRGRYSGEDCEHVTFHRSICDGTGVLVNPSQRTMMRYIEEFPTDGGQHVDD